MALGGAQARLRSVISTASMPTGKFVQFFQYRLASEHIAVFVVGTHLAAILGAGLDGRVTVRMQHAAARRAKGILPEQRHGGGAGFGETSQE
jgi:hypothetical protein